MGVIRCLSAAIIASLSATQLSAQGTGRVDGRVVDSTSQQPLSNVTIAIPGTSLGALSRGDGTFSLTGVPAGSQRLHARRIGYALQERVVNIAAGQTAGLTRSAALEFSFFLSIPVMFAATGFKLLQAVLGKSSDAHGPIDMTAHRWGVLAVGFVVSFFVAWAVIAWFMAWVRKRGFVPFAIYRIVLGVFVLWLARNAS